MDPVAFRPLRERTLLFGLGLQTLVSYRTLALAQLAFAQASRIGDVGVICDHPVIAAQRTSRPAIAAHTPDSSCDSASSTMPAAASEAAAKRLDDAVRAKDEDALREAVKADDTRELGSLAVLRCAETGWIAGLRAAVEAGAIYRCKTASGASPAHLAAMGCHLCGNQNFTARSNHRVVLHAIDATPARWRGDAGSSPLDGARTTAPSPRNDLVKNCRVHPTLVDFHTGGHDILHVILDLDKSAVKAVNAQKQTPLHFAAVGGNALAVSALVRNGADVNAATSDGSTALHYACGKVQSTMGSERPMDGWERCVHVLLDNGADPFARDSKGKTPRDRLPPDARARGVLQDFIRKKEAAAEAAAEALCAEPEAQAPAPKQRKARRRKPAPSERVASRLASGVAKTQSPSLEEASEAEAVEAPVERARAASLADDATPWSTVVRRKGAATQPAPAAPPAPPPPQPPRDVNELFAALFPAAPALALRAEHLLLPSEDLSPSQLEAVHDILDACTRRVIDARVAVAARTRSEVASSSS